MASSTSSHVVEGISQQHSPTPSHHVEAEASDVPSDQLSLGKRKRSDVWKHFDMEIINGKEKAICKYYRTQMVGHSKDGTFHLRKHIEKSCNAIDRASIQRSRLGRTSEGTLRVAVSSFDPDATRKELVHMIIKHEYPLSIVDHIGLQIYSNALQPLFKMVSCNTVKNDVMKVFDCEKKEAMQFIESNKTRVAITSDMWTSNNQKKGFMAIMTHFIDNDWNLQSRILRFTYVPCPYINNALCNVLLNCFLEWNIDRKISTITLDNCLTNDKMIETFMGKLDPSSLLCSGKLIHMRSCAHILNLIVKDGLKVIKGSIEKVRESVLFWTATPKREEMFEKSCKQLSIPCTWKLVLDCPPRWNSTYLMLQSALMYKVVFGRLKQCESSYKSLPTDEEWELAKEICGKFKVFYSVTELFSRTKYPTANIFFAKISEIRLTLNKWLEVLDPNIKKMASNILVKFNKYWNMIHGIIGVATVLDPRYKMKLIEFYYPQIFGIKYDYEVRKIKQLCEDLILEYQLKTNINDIIGESRGLVLDAIDGGSQDALNAYDQFIMNEKMSNSMRLKSEFEHYLEEDVLPKTSSFDILVWWKISGVKFPLLQSIAKEILSIPVSIVASKSAFSTGGRLVSAHRSRLHPNIVEALMCAQDWIWAK